MKARLIHPVAVVVEQLDAENTDFDEVTGEPAQQVDEFGTDVAVATKVAISMPGQIAWQEKYAYNAGQGGQVLKSSGYVLFERGTLEEMGVTLALNDRITSVDEDAVDLVIVGLTTTGHYRHWTLMRATFLDRAKGM